MALSGIGVGLCGFSQRSFALPPDTPSAGSAGTSPRRRVLLQSEWRFQKENEPLPTELPAIKPEFDDSSWETVGVPHCYNDMDSFENANMSETYQGIAWYRTRFKLDEAARGKKVFLEFGGVVIAAAVYINGRFKPGNTAVPQPGQVAHVGDFLPFVLDITEDVLFSGDNVLAVRVGNVSERAGYAHEKPLKNRQAFYTVPGFGMKIDFGMGFGGIVCPVALNITQQVHVPSNAYSPLQKWGSYAGTTSASDDAAQVRIQINVTAGDPHHVVLSVEPRLTKPSGETFEITANGSDAPIVTAKIVDARGNWCPLAGQNIRFKVSGPGLYRGSYNFYVTSGQPLNYHAPGDFELQAEGALMRVAVRSTFQPGNVQVSVEADGLGPGSASFETKALLAT